ncbi:hypothetical protein HJG60_010763 [Phyllostomus discolor]|uniref:Uncharacterized protein n=1 Tax=Phyllostomus discolor TaxID=89673 RepID=A0A834A7G9_9CHIR|nr:hypothetical protein HJG60_010763 [Phyllostomus discolor]
MASPPAAPWRAWGCQPACLAPPAPLDYPPGQCGLSADEPTGGLPSRLRASWKDEGVGERQSLRETASPRGTGGSQETRIQARWGRDGGWHRIGRMCFDDRNARQGNRKALPVSTRAGCQEFQGSDFKRSQHLRRIGS